MKLKIIFLCCVIYLVSARFSGFYYDNGVDQTIIQKFLSNEDKSDVEHEMLSLLGLPYRPRPRHSIPVHLGSSAPKFLLDVYKSLRENPSITSDFHTEFTLSWRDQKAIDESDVIMSFLPKGKTDPVRHGKGKRLWFDVSEVPVEDTIVGCELRLYQTPFWLNLHKGVSLVVTVFLVLPTSNGLQELHYVDYMNTTSKYEGWLTFNMIKALTKWVASPNSNLGIYISVTPSTNPSHELRPGEIGLALTNLHEEHQPFLVAFFKSSGVKEAKIRKEREARRRKKKSDNPRNNPLLVSPNHWTYRSCRLHNLYVNFKDLNWDDWIIAPEGYEAFFCSGECNFPLNAHMNATNHAIVQTLVHLMNPVSVPKPCCTPTKLTSISVLFFIEESNVILKKYKNMVVRSCGCH